MGHNSKELKVRIKVISLKNSSRKRITFPLNHVEKVREGQKYRKI